LATRSEAVLAWPDSRNSVLPGTAQDLFAATVTHRSPQQPSWGRALGAGLLGCAILAMAVLALGRRTGRTVASGTDEASAADDDGGIVPVPPARRRGVRVGVAILAGVGGIVGVAVASPDGKTVLPGPQVVDLTMTDNRYEYLPPARAGRVVFRVRNAGTQQHRIAVYPLPEDMPPIDVQLRGSERRNVERLAAPLPRRPEETQSFAVDLQPGQRYAFLCFLRSPTEQKTYAELGMSSEFRAGP
jgi:hypothetical protein